MLSFRLTVVSAIVMLAIACGGGYSSPSTAPSPTPSPTPTPGGSSSSVSIPVGASSLGIGAYSPHELSVIAGTTVTWMNPDAESHTSTSDVAGWHSGVVAPGGQFSVAF
jgi:plastocyanin